MLQLFSFCVLLCLFVANLPLLSDFCFRSSLRINSSLPESNEL